MELVPYRSSRRQRRRLGEGRGENYSPSQISAFILQKMKETAEAIWARP
jgi:molecular chaperone DnaK